MLNLLMIELCCMLCMLCASASLGCSASVCTVIGTFGWQATLAAGSPLLRGLAQHGAWCCFQSTAKANPARGGYLQTVSCYRNIAAMLVCLHHHDVVMKDVHHDVVRSAITVATLACTVSMLRSHGITCTPSSHDVAH